MSTAPRQRRRLIIAGSLLGVGGLILAGCASGGGASSEDFTYLGQTENTTIVGTLDTLASGACASVNETTPLVTDDTTGTQWDQQLQLLVSQGGLSDLQMAPATPDLMKEFIDAGQVLDLTPVLDDAGLTDAILPAAASTIEALYGQDDLYALPTEFNIEGIWYNKTILADNGIDVPQTWDELVAAAAALSAAGIQPFSASGDQGWPITRLVGGYIFRDLGPDALQKVADGEAKLTDPEYVAAAQAVADLGAAGYFGPAVGSVDYSTAMNSFLTGQAAFFYMGSWALSNFNDPAQNTIGEDAIGYMPFPAVEGGAGSIDQVPANVGIPVMFSQSGYDDSTAAWLDCIVQNYGDVALADSGVISGFVISDPPADLPAPTQLVQSVMADAPSSVLWFEALFTAKGTSVSQTNAAGLVTGSVSAEEFMDLVQRANDEG